MSDSDEQDDFVYYGTPFEELTEDEIRCRKAPRLDDQVATDTQGRRRFHGAFTGGFSAGYFNSVGSKEGWAPMTFVSSRNQRADRTITRPEDLMDDEDLGEHGIAPNSIRATNNFDSHDAVKRKRVLDPSRPIPGVPVLEEILKPTRETMGMQILKHLGWRLGQGVGPRLSSRAKQTSSLETQRLYGCQRPGDNDTVEDSDAGMEEVTFAPADVESMALLSRPKADQFGLGYRPLDRSAVFSAGWGREDGHILDMTEKKKRVLIRGQAFGVGAFENEDDDIYSKEDMSNYDFGPTEKEKNRNNKAIQMTAIEGLTKCLDGFHLGTKSTVKNHYHRPPSLPKDFIPKHTPKKFRFEMKESEVQGLGRHEMTPGQRSGLLQPQAVIELRHGTKSDPKPKVTEKLTALDTTEIEKLYEEFMAEQSQLDVTFKPFARDVEKQRRYDLFIRLKERKQKDKFHLAQPKSMTEWEKEREVQEFERAAHLFRPLSSSMSSRLQYCKVMLDSVSIDFLTIEILKCTKRFVTALTNDAPLHLKDGLNENVAQNVPSTSGKSADPLLAEVADDRLKAAKAGMFGVLTQMSHEWHPDKLLCKRFNVPHPFPESNVVGVLRGRQEKSSIFNVLSAPLADMAGLKHFGDFPENVLSTIEIDTNSSKVQESVQETEDYGLNVSTEGPPTMDLFKAIFMDSETDSDTEIDVTSSKSMSNDSEKLPKIGHSNNSDVYVESSHSDAIPGKRSHTSRFAPRQQPTVGPMHFFRKPEYKAENETISSGSVPYLSSPKGIFANIDFSILNSYREMPEQSSLKVDETVPQSQEHKMIDVDSKSEKCSSVDSEDEYGPHLPACLPNKSVGSKKIVAKTDVAETFRWIEKTKECLSDGAHKQRKMKHKNKKHKKKSKKHKK